MKCTCGHHKNEHDPDAGWCMMCDCMGWEEPDKEDREDKESKDEV